MFAPLSLLVLLLGGAIGAVYANERCFSTRANPVLCDTLIVGAGAGGLYSAYLLSYNKSNAKGVCVVEAQDRVGGRIYDVPAPNSSPNEPLVYGTCAKRVMPSQPLSRCLQHKLNITLQSSDFATYWAMRGRWGLATSDFAGMGKHNDTFIGLPSDIEDLETALYEYTFLGATTVNPITGENTTDPRENCANFPNVLGYLQAVVGDEAAAFMLGSDSFRGDYLLDIDVCSFIQYFNYDWNNDYGAPMYPIGGWSNAMNMMHDISAAKGVRFFLGEEVSCLDDEPEEAGSHQYAVSTTSGKAFLAKRLIINAPPQPFIESLGGPKVTPSIQDADGDPVHQGSEPKRKVGSLGSKLLNMEQLSSIKGDPVISIQAFWPERWWEPLMTELYPNALNESRLFRINTDGNCINRIELEGHPYARLMNASRIVYADAPDCVNFWMTAYLAGSKEDPTSVVTPLIMTLLRGMLPDIEIPEPTKIDFFLKMPAWHYMMPYTTAKFGFTNADIVEWAAAPIAGAPICFVGEAYNIDGSGWVQGALESAVSCLKAQFSDRLDQSIFDTFSCSNMNMTEAWSNEWSGSSVQWDATHGGESGIGRRLRKGRRSSRRLVQA